MPYRASCTIDPDPRRIHGPRNEGITESVHIFHENRTAAIVGEHHSCSARIDLLLHNHAHPRRVHSTRAAIEKRPLRPVRCPARKHCALERSDIGNVEHRIELARK